MNIAPEKTCDACGKFGAVLFADEAVCVDCYSERGSSCAGARKDVEELPTEHAEDTEKV